MGRTRAGAALCGLLAGATAGVVVITVQVVFLFAGLVAIGAGPRLWTLLEPLYWISKLDQSYLGDLFVLEFIHSYSAASFSPPDQ